MKLQISRTQNAKGVHELIFALQAGAGLRLDGLEHQDLGRIRLLAKAAVSACAAVTACAACTACTACAAGTALTTSAAGAADTAIATDAAIAAIATGATGTTGTARAAGTAGATGAATNGQLDGIRGLGIVDLLVEAGIVGVGGADQGAQIQRLIADHQQLIGNVKAELPGHDGGGLGRLEAHIVGIEPRIAHHVDGDIEVILCGENILCVGNGA